MANKYAQFSNNDNQEDQNTNQSTTKDSNGNPLNTGDSVHTIKDLKVKGMPTTLKVGTVIKNIKLTQNDDEVECKIGKSTVVLRTEFLKRK